MDLQDPSEKGKACQVPVTLNLSMSNLAIQFLSLMPFLCLGHPRPISLQEDSLTSACWIGYSDNSLKQERTTQMVWLFFLVTAFKDCVPYEIIKIY